MATLAAVEASVPVAQWTVADVAVWPLVRVRWFFAEWARLYGTADAASSHRGGTLRAMAAGALAGRRARRDDATGEDERAAPRDVVLLSDGLSFALLGDRWVERFCDPVIAAARALGLSTSLWTPLHHRHRPRSTRSAWIQGPIDRANLAGGLRARAMPPGHRLDGLDQARQLVIGRGLGAAHFDVGRIVSDGARLQAVAALYGRWLRRMRPRIACVVSFYSLEGMAFVLACRRLGIPVADLQHGVQGEHHPAYAAWQAPPYGTAHALLPDRFWVWSAWEATTIESWSRGTAHAPVIGGNPWLDVWRTGSTWPGVASARECAAALQARAQGRPVVLVTLQFGLAPAEQLDPLVDLVREAADRLCFWVRLHPAMLDRREEVRHALVATGGLHEIDLCTDLPLHALLPWADAHLTHSSTTVIEAAQFGVRSVVTSNYGAELFEHLIDAGIVAVRRGSAADVAAALVGLARGDTRHGDGATGAATDNALRALLSAAPTPRETP